MSALIDAQRREDALHARVEKSKRIRRLMDQLVALHLEGLSISVSAQRVGVSPDTVEWLLYVVGINTNTGALRRRAANADKRTPAERVSMRKRRTLSRPGRGCLCDPSWAVHGPDCELLAEAVLGKARSGP